MSLIPRLPLFAAAFTLISLTLALVFLSGQSVPAAQAQTTTPTTATTVDYDSNDDRLIEISNLAQLNAIRWDLNGDGAVAAADQSNYTAAFPNAATGMGCPDGSDADANPDPCLGYELKADLTFDTNADGSVTAADSAGLYWNNGAGWTPIGDARRYTYTGQFQGRGKTISHLFINNSSATYVGLFGAVGSGGRITGVGLTDVSLASSRPAVAGSLVGSNAGSVTASYATGTVSINVGGVTNANSIAGGLTGHNTLTGAAQVSFAEVAVSARHSSASAIVGGLTGQNDGNIRASYAAGAVSVTGNTRFTKAGGLAGNNGGTITASYARGRVSAAGSGAAAGGLVGGNLRNGRVVASYWDTTASGQTGSAGGTGQTTRALQTPSGYNYSGIYASWNLNLDGTAGGDDPWYFGGVNQYPLLVYGTMRDFPLWDYDTDNDQLIEVNNLAQLNAIRWDLNTDGVVAAADQDNYDAAFPGAVTGMGCARGTTAAACAGYELMSDLDFDTDGDGSVDVDDEFWNSGRGWDPIGDVRGSNTASEYLAKTFHGTFRGNGKSIANLYINHTQTRSDYDLNSGIYDADLGMFGTVGPDGVIDGVKLRDVNIHAQSRSATGALAGGNSGTIRRSSSTGHINVNSRTNSIAGAGGLVGGNRGNISGSYAKVEIAGNPSEAGGLAIKNSCSGIGEDVFICGRIVASYSSGSVSTTYSGAWVGGLVGVNTGTITAAYSRSPVKATGNGSQVGGLVGENYQVTRRNITYPATITASYAIGPVVATGANPSVGGLVGHNGKVWSGQEVANSKGTAVDSYWDIEVSGQSSSALGTGMRGHGPTSYTGLFANWNLNLDGVAGKDDPWDLTGGHYPMLKYGGLSVADQAQLYIWRAPVVGETARTSWSVAPWLTRARGQKFVWERSDDGVTGWTVVLSNQAGIGLIRGGSVTFFIEPYEANKRFRVRGLSVERGWISGYITKPVVPWGGPTTTLTFASGHTSPRVGQAIAISGSNAVRWIRCADTADNGCDVIVQSATGYTPVAADQGKYLYAYRYYDNSSGVKTMVKTAVIGPVGAAATTP